METIGTHYIVEMFGCPEHLLNDRIFVNVAMREAVIASDTELIEGISHQFSPQGVTALGLLSESHISIHTWPEHGYVAVDIFTCGTRANPYNACTHLIKAFQADRHTLNKLTRGIDPIDQGNPNARSGSDDQMVVSTSTVSTT